MHNELLEGNFIANFEEQDNRVARIHREWEKNWEEKQFDDCIRYRLQSLYHLTPTPLIPSICEENINISIFHLDFIHAASDIGKELSLNQYGIFLAIAGAISCSLWGRVIINVKGTNWSEPAIDWIMQFAYSGSRKTYLIDTILEPFKEYQELYNKSLSEADIMDKSDFVHKFIRMHKTNIMRKLCKDTSDFRDINEIYEAYRIETDKFQIPSDLGKLAIELCFTCGTVCGLEKAMVKHGGSQAIITSDMDSLMNLIHEKSDLLLKAHCQEQYGRRTAHNNIIIPQCSVPIVTITQPNKANELYHNERLLGNGFINRLIPYFYPHCGKTRSFTLEQDWYTGIQKYKRIIKNNLTSLSRRSSGQGNSPVTIYAEPCKELDEFREELRGICPPDEPITGFFSKLPGQALRFAADMHFGNHRKGNPLDTPVTHEEVLQGIELARIAIPHAQFLYSQDGLRAFEDARLLVKEWYRNYDINGRLTFIKKGTSTNETSKRCGLSTTRVNKAFDLLQKHQILIVADDGNANKRAFIHPKYFNVNPEQNARFILGT